MAKQLIFDLPVKPAFGRDNYLVSPSNEQAVRQIEKPEDWPLARAVLVGEKGCGKTHLARVWQQATGALFRNAADLTDAAPDELTNAGSLVVEDVDGLAGQDKAERALFHLINVAEAAHVALLMTAGQAPARLGVCLPDLKSRLNATQLIRLNRPDDQLLSAMLIKQFGDRQLVVSPRVISFLLPRMDRTAEAVRSIVAELDSRALAQNTPVTVRLAREVLDNQARTQA